MRFSGIMSIAHSGMRASTLRLQSSAHNVANLNTDGFDPLRVVQQDRANGGVSATVETVNTQNPTIQRGSDIVETSGTDLGEEMVEQLVAQRSHEANIATLRTADEILGALLDETV